MENRDVWLCCGGIICDLFCRERWLKIDGIGGDSARYWRVFMILWASFKKLKTPGGAGGRRGKIGII